MIAMKVFDAPESNMLGDDSQALTSMRLIPPAPLPP